MEEIRYNPWTYTLVIKGELGQAELNETVRLRLHGLAFTAVAVRQSKGETLALIHAGADSSSYGRALAAWFGEPGCSACHTNPRGALLWYR